MTIKRNKVWRRHFESSITFSAPINESSAESKTSTAGAAAARWNFHILVSILIPSVSVALKWQRRMVAQQLPELLLLRQMLLLCASRRSPFDTTCGAELRVRLRLLFSSRKAAIAAPLLHDACLVEPLRTALCPLHARSLEPRRTDECRVGTRLFRVHM